MEGFSSAENFTIPLFGWNTFSVVSIVRCLNFARIHTVATELIVGTDGDWLNISLVFVRLEISLIS